MPEKCTCGAEGRRVVVGTLEQTLNCPALWAELPDGTWQHDWPARKKQVNR